MGRRRKIRDLIGLLKDKASLIKATFSPKRAASSIHVAVLQATTHSSSSSSSFDHRVSAVLHLGSSSRAAASSCIQAIMDRLHHTHNAYVALKCVITLHHVMTHGTFILKDQLSFYPSAGGHNFLNLSNFRDGADVKSSELSTWVRWYGGVLELNLITSRILGSYLSSSFSKFEKQRGLDSVTSSFNSDLVREIEALVGMVEEICRYPNSLYLKQNNLVYQLIKLVGEDYRSTQYQITIRLSESDNRMVFMSSTESAELMGCLKRLEECREKLVGLFLNRHRNDGFWNLVNQTRIKLRKMKEERERGRLIWIEREESESTRFDGRFGGPSPVLQLAYGYTWTELI